MFKSKKAQLGAIEAKYFIFGLIAGFIIGIVLAILNSKGIINVPLL